MLAEYESQYGSTRNLWTSPKIHGNRPLKMSHVLLAFILLGATLTLSLIVFVTELWLGRKEQGVGGQRDKRRRSREARLNGTKRMHLEGRRGETARERPF